MNRDTAYKVSRNVEEYLGKRSPPTEEAKALIAAVVEKTLAKLQTHLGADLDDVAKKAGGALANDLHNNLFELANTWFDSQRHDMMIVPEGTRFVHRQGAKVYLVLEEKPTIRSISYIDARGTRHNYRIALPFVNFIFPASAWEDDNGYTRYKVESARFAFGRKPLTSLEQPLFYPCLPNVDTNSGRGEMLKICMGQEYKPDLKADLPTQIANYVAHFWNAPFGQDWPHEYDAMRKRDRRFELPAWQEASKENPLFVLDEAVPFRIAGTFANIMQTNIQIDDNNINVPLKKVVKRAVDSMTDQIIKAIRRADLLKDFNPKQVESAVYDLMCSVVRNCVENITKDMVVTEKADFNEKRDRLEEGLTEILNDLQRRVKGQEKPNYWTS